MLTNDAEVIAESLRMQRTDLALAVQGVACSYRPLMGKHHPVLKDVSLHVDRGAICGIVGANGAGKTTFLRMLAGLIRPEQGELKVLGLDPCKDRAALMARSGVLLSGKRNFPDRWTVREVLEYSALLYQGRRGISEVADTFLLSDKLNLQVAELSLGNRQRLSLASIFVHDPEIALLDEPTLGLDSESIDRMLAFLALRSREGKTTIVTSHDHGVLGRMVTEVVLLRNGMLVPYHPEEHRQGWIRLTLDRLPDVALPDGVLQDGTHLRLPNRVRLLAEVFDRLGAADINIIDMRRENQLESLMKKEEVQGAARL
ncbi:ABC transporter ATP-binding protein [Deinococcus misasensis]|uniref:ABC transporter ATP-binding protein n=1 Tax=Deinococcus misasensis TaxID=392413 RepID=UPI0012F9D33C|nr:ABC transporter ATP-binding protein [Deinococcus misasensis]